MTDSTIHIITSASVFVLAMTQIVQTLTIRSLQKRMGWVEQRLSLVEAIQTGTSPWEGNDR